MVKSVVKEIKEPASCGNEEHSKRCLSIFLKGLLFNVFFYYVLVDMIRCGFSYST